MKRDGGLVGLHPELALLSLRAHQFHGSVGLTVRRRQNQLSACIHRPRKKVPNALGMSEQHQLIDVEERVLGLELLEVIDEKMSDDHALDRAPSHLVERGERHTKTAALHVAAYDQASEAESFTP